MGEGDDGELELRDDEDWSGETAAAAAEVTFLMTVFISCSRAIEQALAPTGRLLLIPAVEPETLPA